MFRIIYFMPKYRKKIALVLVYTKQSSKLFLNHFCLSRKITELTRMTTVFNFI